MSTQEFNPTPFLRASDQIRLRTLVTVRWFAIFGQLLAVNVAQIGLHLLLPLGLCYVAIGLSAIINFYAVLVFPKSKRLFEKEATVALFFDLSQLSFLLYLTGGVTNPFALLIVAPVTISALALDWRPTFFLATIAILYITIINFFGLPLQFSDGSYLVLPNLISFGFWAAIVVGILFLALYSRRVSVEMRALSDALFATQMALVSEQKLAAIGGIVAATAHELGTPLATIKLASSEMIGELSDRPFLAEDARLIKDQADRCKDILRSMGQVGVKKFNVEGSPLIAVLKEAAEPHENRGKKIKFTVLGHENTFVEQPVILGRLEIIHGLRNLIQNAVDFCKETVWVDVRWTDQTITIRITDDGGGYPPHILARIGDPFVQGSQRFANNQQRPEYEGMGLGLFIAKTLLERTGAELTFANYADMNPEKSNTFVQSGATIEISWLRNLPGLEEAL